MTSPIHYIKPIFPCITVHRHLLSSDLFSSRLLIASIFISLLAACSPSSEPVSISASDENPEAVSTKPNDAIVVYSSRNEHLIQPVFALFTEQTGIDVKYTTDKAGVLIERIKSEGKNTPADVLITVDAGTLGYAAQQGIFQTLDSAVVAERVPAYLRDDNDYWTGLSLRARTIVYSTERVKPEQLSSYQDLGSAQWQGRVCLRTSKKVYNQSLVAMLIAEQGEAKAESIVSSWVDNLAIPPTSNDTKVMDAILVGQCDVGIINTYYFGRLQTKIADLPLALFWPNQTAEANSGVHVNVAGVGILKHSKNAAQAKRLVEWLVSDSAQALFAGVNKEYPINDSVEVNPQVASWGRFKQNPLPLSQAYLLQPAAVKLMDRAGYK
ncbi:extracellular solute-binding protein [Pseudomonadales bacterium]|nr:extracellular solute-binding protein [Pseudomonadales bacterium]